MIDNGSANQLLSSVKAEMAAEAARARSLSFPSRLIRAWILLFYARPRTHRYSRSGATQHPRNAGKQQLTLNPGVESDADLRA